MAKKPTLDLTKGISVKRPTLDLTKGISHRRESTRTWLVLTLVISYAVLGVISLVPLFIGKDAENSLRALAGVGALWGQPVMVCVGFYFGEAVSDRLGGRS